MTACSVGNESYLRTSKFYNLVSVHATTLCLRWEGWDRVRGGTAPRDDAGGTNGGAAPECARSRAVAPAPAMAAAGLPHVDFSQIKTRSIERTLLPLVKQVCFVCMLSLLFVRISVIQIFVLFHARQSRETTPALRVGSPCWRRCFETDYKLGFYVPSKIVWYFGNITSCNRRCHVFESVFHVIWRLLLEFPAHVDYLLHKSAPPRSYRLRGRRFRKGLALVLPNL